MTMLAYIRGKRQIHSISHPPEGDVIDNVRLDKDIGADVFMLTFNGVAVLVYEIPVFDHYLKNKRINPILTYSE